MFVTVGIKANVTLDWPSPEVVTFHRYAPTAPSPPNQHGPVSVNKARVDIYRHDLCALYESQNWWGRGRGQNPGDPRKIEQMKTDG